MQNVTKEAQVINSTVMGVTLPRGYSQSSCSGTLTKESQASGACHCVLNEYRPGSTGNEYSNPITHCLPVSLNLNIWPQGEEDGPEPHSPSHG